MEPVTTHKTADMAAYKRAWKAANPDKVKAYVDKYNRKRKTAKWKATHRLQIERLRKWKAEYQRRKRAEARGKAYEGRTPEQVAFIEKRKKARAEAARALARHAGRTSVL